MGEASDDIKLTSGSVIEITRLPGYTLETKGKDTKTTSIFPRFSFDTTRNLKTKKLCLVGGSYGSSGEQG